MPTFTFGSPTSSSSATSSRLPPVDSFLKEKHLLRLQELAFEPKYPPTADENGGEELDTSELLQWNLNFRQSPPGIFLPVFVKTCLQLLREDERSYVSDSDSDDEKEKEQDKKKKKKNSNKPRRHSEMVQNNTSFMSAFSHTSSNNNNTDNNNQPFSSSPSSPSDSSYMTIDGKTYLERDVTIALIRWAVAVGVRARVEHDYFQSYQGGSLGSSNENIADNIVREITENAISPAHKKRGINFEERFAHLLSPLDEEGNSGRRRGRRSPPPLLHASASQTGSLDNIVATASSSSHEALSMKPTVLDLNAGLSVDFNTVISPAEIRLTTDALLGPSEIVSMKIQKAEAEERQRKREEEMQIQKEQEEEDQRRRVKTGKLRKINMSSSHQSNLIRRKSSVRLLSPSLSNVSGNNTDSFRDFNSLSGNLNDTYKSNDTDDNNNNNYDDYYNGKNIPVYWQRDLRDYFLRWTDITTSLLAGAAKSAFKELDGNTASVSTSDNNSNQDNERNTSFMPYASTRVVKTLRKRAAAAAKAALLGKNSSLSVGNRDDDDDGSSSEDYDDDDDDFDLMNPMSAKALKKRQLEETEMLHHGPVTAAVLAPKLNGIVTGSSDGSVKLWSRDSGDFIKNIYCCSGRTTIVGLSYVECGNASDVVVIGTSLSHLALYSTMTNSIVKEYSGTSEKLNKTNNNSDNKNSNNSSRSFMHHVPHVPLRPTETASRYRALPGSYGKRLIRPPPISSSMDSTTFFNEWRSAQDKEVPRTVPGAQVQNLSRLSLLRTIYPSTYTHGIICFGTADGDVGLLDLHEDFIDAVLYGQPTDRHLSSHNVLNTHSNTVTAAAYCKRHRSILSSAFDGTVMPRNIDTNELMSPIGFKTKAVVSMDWCESQQILATVTTDRKAYAWSILGKRPIHEFELDSRPVSVVLHSGKSQMAVLCDDRRMLIYDTRTFRCLQGLSVVGDQAEREATIVVGGLDDSEGGGGDFASASTMNDDDVSSKATTLATVNASSNYISPYDQSATMQLAAGGQNGRKNRSKLQSYQAENNTGLLLSDGTDIVAVHREVSVLKDSLGKVSVRVRQGKIPVYGFKFDVYDEELEKRQKEEELRVRQQQLLFDQSFANSTKAYSLGRRATFAASMSRLQAKQQSDTSVRSKSFFGAASAKRAPPVLKSSPIGIIFNKHNGSLFVADADGFLSIDVKSGEVLMCVAAEKNLGQTTPSVASGGRLVAGTQAFCWTPCDSGKLKGIQHDTFLTLAKSGCITEWNAVDGVALRVTLPQGWASCLDSKKHKRPRKDKPFTTMAICEKLTAIAQDNTVFILNEVARKAPKPTDLNLLNDIFLSSSNNHHNNHNNGNNSTSNANKAMLLQSLQTSEEAHDEQENNRKEAIGLVGDLNMKSARLGVGVPSSPLTKTRSTKNNLQSAQAVADIKKWRTEKQIEQEQSEMAKKAATISKKQDDRNTKKIAKTFGSEDNETTKDSNNDENSGEEQTSSTGTNNNNNNKGTTNRQDMFHNRSFEGHDAFSVDCEDRVTCVKFSAGGEYLAIGTAKGLLHTVHVETSENVYMTLSMLRAGEPTSPIVSVTWNEHIGDCTVFAAVALGRIIAIHAPTRNVMLSLHVDLGHKLSPTLLTSIAVCRHQSRSGHALELLSFGDSSGNVSVATLQVKKQRELYQELHPEEGGANSSSDPTFEDSKNNNNNNLSRPTSRASSVGSAVSQISSFSRSKGGRKSAGGGRRSVQSSSHHRKTSFLFQQIQKKEDGTGFHWTQPIAVQQLPERDHSLKRLKSLKLLYGEAEDEYQRQYLNDDDEEEFKQEIDLDFDNFDSSDSSSSDSDDDPTVELKKIKSPSEGKNSNIRDNDDDDESEEEDDLDRTLAKMVGGDKAEDALNSTKTYKDDDDENNTGRLKGPDSAHQTDASKKHEKSKLQRRSAIFNDQAKIKLISGSKKTKQANVVETNRAVAKLRGTFSKKRRGFIFEDAYCFVDPAILMDENNNNNNKSGNNTSGKKNAGQDHFIINDYSNVEGILITRQDQRMEQPVWTGYIDGHLCLSSRKSQQDAHSTGGIAIGAVTQIVFLELKREGLNHGLALFAAATADGNISLLRWCRLSNDAPATLISLTTLKCPISSLSRGPFWHESKVELDVKEESRKVQEEIKRREMASSSSFSLGNNPGTEQAFTIGRRKSAVHLISPDNNNSSQKPKPVDNDSLTASPSFFLTQDQTANENNTNGSSNKLAHMPSATFGTFIGDASPTSSNPSPASSIRKPEGLTGTSSSHSKGLAAAFAGAGRIAAKLKEKAKIARLEHQEKQSREYLPVTSAWSPIGTGVEHDETNMVYCLDDRWEQCDERDLKDRTEAEQHQSLSRAKQKAIRREALLEAKRKKEEEEQDRQRKEQEHQEMLEMIRQQEKEEEERQKKQREEREAARRKRKKSMSDLFNNDDDDSNDSDDSMKGSHDEQDSDEEGDDDMILSVPSMDLDATVVPGVQTTKKQNARTRQVSRKRSLKNLQRKLSQIHENPESFSHAVMRSGSGTSSAAAVGSLTTSPQVSSNFHLHQNQARDTSNVSTSSSIVMPPLLTPKSGEVHVQRTTSFTDHKLERNATTTASLSPQSSSSNLVAEASPPPSTARSHHHHYQRSSSNFDLKINRKLLESARELSQSGPGVSASSARTPRMPSTPNVTTPQEGTITARSPSSKSGDLFPATNRHNQQDDLSSHHDQQQQEQHSQQQSHDSQQHLLTNTFNRLKHLRPNLRVQEPYPLLDAVTLKHEQIDDIKRDVQRQLEKEKTPAWLKAMRKTTQPISIQQVHIMSRPPPILLKNHKRVNALDDPKEPKRS